MKKLIALIFVISLSQYAIAEPGQGCNKQDKLIKKLELQEDQVAQVEQILSEQKSKRREIFEANRDAIKQQMEGIHNETRDKLDSVLTAEQMQTFEQLHTERMEKREKRRQERMERVSESQETVES